jgi:hypothetical protein
MTSRISLTRYLVEKQRVHDRIPADLRLLIEVVARACKGISHAVTKGALGEVLGSAGTDNVQGEVQKKLDIIANEVLIEANEWGGHLAAMASEEMEGIYVVPNRYPQGEYLLLFDPLDGSSNSNVSTAASPPNCACCLKLSRAPASASALPSTRANSATSWARPAPRTCKAKCKRSWTSLPTKC